MVSTARAGGGVSERTDAEVDQVMEVHRFMLDALGTLPQTDALAALIATAGSVLSTRTPAGMEELLHKMRESANKVRARCDARKADPLEGGILNHDRSPDDTEIPR